MLQSLDGKPCLFGFNISAILSINWELISRDLYYILEIFIYTDIYITQNPASANFTDPFIGPQFMSSMITQEVKTSARYQEPRIEPRPRALIRRILDELFPGGLCWADSRRETCLERDFVVGDIQPSPFFNDFFVAGIDLCGFGRVVSSPWCQWRGRG